MEKEIVKMYQQGMTYKQIKKKHCVSHDVIRRILVDANIDIRKTRKKVTSAEQESKIVNDFLEGSTFAELKRKHEVSSVVVYRILKENGIDNRRPVSKFRKKNNTQAQIVNLFKNNRRSLSSIAKICNCSRDAIMNVLSINGFSDQEIRRGLKYSYISNSVEYFFKSSCELEFAVYLDKLNLKWDYEPKKLQANSFSYTPDFIVYIDKFCFVVDVKSFHSGMGSGTANKSYEARKNLVESSFPNCKFLITNPTNYDFVVLGMIEYAKRGSS